MNRSNVALSACLLIALAVLSSSCRHESLAYEKRQMAQHAPLFSNSKKHVEQLVAQGTSPEAIQSSLPKQFHFSLESDGNWSLHSIVKSEFGYGDAIVYRTDQQYPQNGYGGVLVFRQDTLAYYKE